MKGYLIFLVFLLNTIFNSAFAQISDDFSDGNFTDNPVWFGETSKFIVNPESQLQQNAPSESGHSHLSILSEVIDNAEWNFM